MYVNADILDLLYKQLCLSQKTKQTDDKAIRNASNVIWAGMHGICILSIGGKLDLAGEKSAKHLTEFFINNFNITGKKTIRQ